jgi:pantoate--beta-alanine ligase
MVQDLNMPLEIIPVPIKREKDGLAMSSRNTYLSASERKEALCLIDALCICRDYYNEGEKNAENLKRCMVQRINQEPSAVIDYIEICDTETLKPLNDVPRQAVVALAVKIGRTRLIDNMIIGG